MPCTQSHSYHQRRPQVNSSILLPSSQRSTHSSLIIHRAPRSGPKPAPSPPQTASGSTHARSVPPRLAPLSPPFTRPPRNEAANLPYNVLQVVHPRMRSHGVVGIMLVDSGSATRNDDRNEVRKRCNRSWERWNQIGRTNYGDDSPIGWVCADHTPYGGILTSSDET
jgi:hypothetical protein